MRGNRLSDLLILASMIGLGAAFSAYQRQPESSSTPRPTAQASSAVGFPERAVPFQLSTLNGQQESFSGNGPAIFTLTAIGCDGCRKRVPLDGQLWEMANKAKVPVWNLLVYATPPAGANFVAEFAPRADHIVVDPQGQVSVNQYGGSDANCWMMIGADGRFLYRGKEDLDAMKRALDTLIIR